MRAAILLCSLAALAADIQVVTPKAGPKPVGPYSPGLLAGDYLYVSGQGARVGTALAASVEDQTRDCLNNVKSIVEGAGLTMNDVVYAHLYLARIADYEAVNRVWPTYFATLPARATLSVTRMPTDTPIEITVVAYKGRKEAVTLPNSKSPVPISPGMLTADRFYIAGILGRDSDSGVIPQTIDGQIDTMFARLKRVLAAAKLSGKPVAFANLYRTAAVSEDALRRRARKELGANATLFVQQVPALPFGVNVSITGVAARNASALRKEGNCTAIGDTAWCAAETAPGDDVVAQTAATLGPLNLTNALASNLYIDSIDDFAKMNAAYAKAFEGKTLPTRTTVQPLTPGIKDRFRFHVIRLR